jgi:hypothetical protein
LQVFLANGERVYNIRGGRALRIAVGISALAVVLLAGGAGAATLTVDDSGGADYEDTGCD